jgi:hypothetical protein
VYAATKLLMLALLALGAASCARLAQNIVAEGKAARMLPRFAVCPDNAPIRLLIDEHCPGGVCGYSCAPDRWRVVCPPSPVTAKENPL